MQTDCQTVPDCSVCSDLPVRKFWIYGIKAPQSSKYEKCKTVSVCYITICLKVSKSISAPFIHGKQLNTLIASYRPPLGSWRCRLWAVRRCWWHFSYLERLSSSVSLPAIVHTCNNSANGGDRYSNSQEYQLLILSEASSDSWKMI